MGITPSLISEPEQLVNHGEYEDNSSQNAKDEGLSDVRLGLRGRQDQSVAVYILLRILFSSEQWETTEGVVYLFVADVDVSRQGDMKKLGMVQRAVTNQ